MGRLAIPLAVCCCLGLAACEPLAVAMLGAGASTALRYNLDGVAARTFTAPAAAVRNASLAALQRMGIVPNGTSSYDNGELIYGRADNRDIEIELEPITKQATRVRITARSDSLLYDNATAMELVQQTGKMLDAAVATAGATPPRPQVAPATPPTAAMGASAASAN